MSFSDWDRWQKIRKIVLFSGGKDSLATLALCGEHYSSGLEAVYVDTSSGFFPEATEYIKEVCEALSTPLKILKSPDFFDLASRWGFPSIKSRWCCRALKIYPIRSYLQTINEPKVVFSGRRASESRARRDWFERRLKAGHDPAISYSRPFRCFTIEPIWDWSNQQVDEYLKSRSLPLNPLYATGIHHLTCPCLIFKNLKEIERVRVIKPELFNRYKELESSLKNKHWKPIRKVNEYISFRNLERQQLIDRWCAAQ